MHYLKWVLTTFSIIEFAVYGLIGYMGIITLIITILTDPPKSVSLSGIRSIWLMPSIICISMLMFASGIITTDSETRTVITTSNATSEAWTETANVSKQITLVNPIWATVHFAFFIMMILYIIQQVLTLLFQKPD